MVLRSNYTFRITFSLLLLVGTLSSIEAQKVEKLMGKEAKDLWENAGEIAQIPISQDMISTHDEIHDGDVVYRISDTNDGSDLGYVVSTSAMGRFDAFDYFIIYDEKLRVLSVRVAVYRSSHGSAICNKRWLKQFIGFGGGETLVYGKDIQAVTGATISGGSIVEDIQRSSKVMSILMEEEEI
jgi:hypothetical protein